MENKTPVKFEEYSFEFPIRESNEEMKIKNSPHLALPNFHGLSKEDPRNLFEFDVFYGSYDMETYEEEVPGKILILL